MPNKKEKFKVIGNKIKERMSIKIKNMFDKKKGAGEQNPAPESAHVELSQAPEEPI